MVFSMSARARARSDRTAPMWSPAINRSDGFVLRRWRKFGFVNWNDSIAPRARPVDTVVVYSPAAESETISAHVAGSDRAARRWPKLQGTQLRTVRTYLNVILIHEYADRDYLRYWPGAYCFSRCLGSLSGPVAASSLAIGRSAVDIAKRVSSERDQTFRCTVFHYTLHERGVPWRGTVPRGDPTEMPIVYLCSFSS